MIDEIPIENSDQPIEAETVTEDQQVAEVVEEPKKTRGRPKGTVKKKEEPKAKPKPKKVPKPKVQTYDEDEPEPYEEAAQPMYDTRAIASEVIAMLSNRHLDRSAQKRDKYRSWFQNPQY